MPTRAADPPLRPRSAVAGAPARLLALLLSLLLGATGCSLLPGTDADEGTRQDDVAAAVLGAVTDLADRRTTAVLDDDRRAFLTDVDRSRPRLLRRQRHQAAVLTALPWRRFSFDVDDTSLAADGDRWSVTVAMTTQLAGFDAVPVRTQRRWLVEPDGDGWLLVADRVPPGERDRSIAVAPYLAPDARVRRLGPVLGVFDAGSVDRADGLLAEFRDGVDDVAAQVPYRWNRHVVFYAMSTLSVLSRLPSIPGGDPDDLDGVAFPVTADSGRVASTRIALHPRLLTSSAVSRERLLRHELTHVAVGRRDDRAPVWLAEGIAEYVSVQPLPREERVISASAVAAAADLRQLPVDGTFNGDGSGAHYGIAWWACEYLVRTLGEPILWRLLEALSAGGGVPRERRSAVIRDVTGLTPSQIAERAGRLITQTFR